jgi:hypothetical protein
MIALSAPFLMAPLGRSVMEIMPANTRTGIKLAVEVAMVIRAVIRNME